jgi:hypothetical protein
MAPAVVHNPVHSRFEATVEGQRCICQYRVYGKLMMLTHTGVPHALRVRTSAASPPRWCARRLTMHARRV